MDKSAFLAELTEKLHTKKIAKKILAYEELESTSVFLKEHAKEYPDGTLVLANCQTGGKGSKGRSWQSPKDVAIYMSILLRPQILPVKAPKITLVMATSIVRALKNLGVDAQIKWPNDIVINGKKLAGILTEMSADVHGIKHVVLGMGINVMTEHFSEELAQCATSLWMETKKCFNKAEIVAEVMNCFEQDYEDFVKEGELHQLLEQYKQFSVTLGKEVRVVGINTEYRGRAVDVAKDGCLIVEKEDGQRVSVMSDEVSVRGIYGYV